MMKVDFELVEAIQVYDNLWLKREQTGEITRSELRDAALTNWGVVKELHIKIKAIK